MPETGQPARRVDLDWARALAVLIMIEAHVLDAWTRPMDRTTRAFHYLNILSGFAAPLFLWLAGVASVLTAERTMSRTARRWLVTDGAAAATLTQLALTDGAVAIYTFDEAAGDLVRTGPTGTNVMDVVIGLMG